MAINKSTVAEIYAITRKLTAKKLVWPAPTSGCFGAFFGLINLLLFIFSTNSAMRGTLSLLLARLSVVLFCSSLFYCCCQVVSCIVALLLVYHQNCQLNYYLWWNWRHNFVSLSIHLYSAAIVIVIIQMFPSFFYSFEKGDPDTIHTLSAILTQYNTFSIKLNRFSPSAAIVVVQPTTKFQIGQQACHCVISHNIVSVRPELQTTSKCGCSFTCAQRVALDVLQPRFIRVFP